MQRYRAVIRSGDAMMVPDDDGYYVTRLDAFAYAEQRAREEREAILAMLDEWGRHMTGPLLRTIIERIRARGAKEPAGSWPVIKVDHFMPGDEIRIEQDGKTIGKIINVGTSPDPKPLEKLEWPETMDTVTARAWKKIDEIIDAVEALRMRVQGRENKQ